MTNIDNFIKATIALVPEHISLSTSTRILYEVESRLDSRPANLRIKEWRRALQAITDHNPLNWPLTLTLPNGQLISADTKAEALETISNLIGD